MPSETLGSVIAKRRKERGLTQQELASLVNVTTITISRIERNENNVAPTNRTLKGLSEVLGLDYFYLLALNEQIDDDPELRVIHRAAGKMSQEDRDLMMQILRRTFSDVFAESENDELDLP